MDRIERLPVILSIAGSDNTSGAGIQADIRAAAAAGAYAMTAVTAVTVQGLGGVVAVEPTANVGAQIDEALRIGVDAVKIGLVASAGQAREIASRLESLPEGTPIVVDTIMNPTAGRGFAASADDFAAKMEPLLRIATVATPNHSEFRALYPYEKGLSTAMDGFCRRYGSRAVAVTGVEIGPDELMDVLHYDGGKVRRIPHCIVDTPNTHGTGCSLSAAIAARMAQGRPAADAFEDAVDWLCEALERGADVRFASGWRGAANFF